MEVTKSRKAVTEVPHPNETLLAPASFPGSKMLSNILERDTIRSF